MGDSIRDGLREPMMPVRLVASDLDGTLLSNGPPLRVSPRVQAALAAVQDAGIAVVLVTARNWRSVVEIAELAGVGGVAICSNGAVVFDLATKSVHRAHAVPAGAARDFIDRCRASFGPGDVSFGWETALGAYRDPEYHRAASATTLYSDVYTSAVEVHERVADDHEVTKLLVRHPELDPDALLDALSGLLGDDLAATISGGPFVEVAAAGITKAHALELLCADLGIAAGDVVAVGDQPNDLPMLAWAGRGVAMGNAHPAVLDAGLERTASNDEDGLAIVLESLT